MAKAATAAIPAVAGGIMGALGSQGPSAQTSSSQTVLPSWAQGTGEANTQQAINAAQNMLGPYTGARVAGMTNGAQADIAGLQQTAMSGQPGYNLAQSTLAGLQGFNAPQVNPGSIAGTDLSAYMNPYTQQVANAGLQAIDQQRKQALNTNADQAISQGAFGGSRQGVQEGVTNAQAALGAGQLVSGLQQQNFQNAQQMAGQDISTNLQGQMANQNAQINGAGMQLNAANSGGAMAGQAQQSQISSLLAALQGQGLIQQQNQNQLNADQQAYSEAQQFPAQQLALASGVLSQSPYGSSTYNTQSLPQGNALMGGLGGAIGGLGIAGSLFGKNGAFPISF